MVLITGSGGSIGSALADSLRPDYQVVGMDRDEAENTLVADLTSADSLALAFHHFREQYGEHIAAVIHLAAYFDFTGEQSPLYDEVNVKGSEKLLAALTDFKVERFIYSGTMLVHQPVTPGDKVSEATPIAPKWAYPQSKAATEATIRQHRNGIPCTFLHLAGLYSDHNAVPTLSHQIARIYERDLKSHLYAGDLDAGQSYIHQDDMIALFRRCVERRNELPEDCTILAGEAETLSYSALQDQLGKLIHGEQSWHTISLPQPVAKAGAWLQLKAEPVVPDAIDHGEPPFIRPFLIELASDHYALDISRARQLLDWQPRHSLSDVLPQMVKQLKKDPLAWYQDNGIRPPDWLKEAEELTDNPETLRKRHERWYRQEYSRNLWGPMFNIGLGAWLIGSVPRLNYQSDAQIYSDLISGLLLMIVATLSLSWRLPATRWASAAIGCWVLTAPLWFWTPEPAVYLNSTIIGSMVIAFSVLLRPAPGVSPVAVMTGPDIPPGWSYSPSTWYQRLPIIILAFIGFFISAYMAAYQLGHIDAIWDPFFAGAIAGDGKNGTAEIITSSVSEAWPVPDAGAGALVYLFEILVGLAGSRQRWRTMPWLVILFGFLIVPMGVVSITFIIIQPIILNTWCTLCLIAATVMLLQIPFSLDELIATCQFLKRRKQQGQSVLRVFFVGDTDDDDGRRDHDDFADSPKHIIQAVFGGGVRWWCPGLLICIVLGALLMFSRLLLGVEGAMADAHHLLGALLITISVIALAESGRALRFINLFLALALMICAFVIPTSTSSVIASLLATVLIMAASIPKGPVQSQYGRWSRLIV
ncbi:vitamin K epoxide reductase family protein [Arsukibacterium sp.]|uniref:vitamin K epoxide reductase family protein n=1 Tax=Arsukibacterium sp. TaxID=1977258 RepID=UPI00299EB6D0|nr:vitamin K epoxide reductase family protein [Arsukibacterium sp.]MDX1538915.1 NAD-dependent epimerase/dehydratase family protein [Arsukibacterium sp.]